MGATETVTVLFTDLVGSTELLSRLGPEGAEVLRREHFALLRDQLRLHGGREVKNLGDGLMATFASASDALAGAIAMQQQLDVRNRRKADAPPLRVRIGIATGEADVDVDDYFGVPVVEASRLCASAAGGEVVVTELVRAMVGGRGGHSFESLGPLELKGVDSPVHACTVRWAPLDAASGLSLPARLASAPPTFVGRVEERGRLDAAFKAAVAGDRRLLLLGGEPGVGKTTLAAAVARSAREQGAVVLYGRCGEDLGIPYQPWTEVLAHVADEGGDHLLERLRPDAHLLARLAPGITRRLPGAGTGIDEPDQYLLFGAVARCLGAIEEDAPVVVVLDDLHWADRATLQLLRHLLASPDRGRSLFVGTFRDSEVAAVDPLADLLAASHRESGIERVSLRGLSTDELVELMEGQAGHEMRDDGVELARVLREETNGNPFFVGEMLRHLAETGAIDRRSDGRWVATTDLAEHGLPASVREVVGRRVARLGGATGRILTYGAVIGREFELALVARALDADEDEDEDELLDAIEPAIRAAIVTEIGPSRFAFVHALVGHTLYENLSETRRARLHRRVAEALEDLLGKDSGARVGELAMHWARATSPQDVSKAIEYARRAGERALEQLAPDEALRWFRQALELCADQPDDPRRRGALLVGLGDAQRQVGAPEHRETLLEAAALATEVADDELLVRAALANNRGWHSRTGSADADRIHVLEAALRVAGDRSAVRARLLGLLAVELTSAGDGAAERRLAYADQAVTAARASGDPATLARVLDAAVFATWVPERLDDRAAWSTELLALATALGDPVLEYWATARRTTTALETQDRDLHDTLRARQLELAEQLGLPAVRWHATCVEVARAFLDGELEDADRIAGEALELGLTSGQPDALSYYGAQLVTIRSVQGRLPELDDLIRQQMEANPGIPAFRGAYARLCVEAGRLEDSVRVLADDIANGFASFPHDAMRLVNLSGCASALAPAGDVAGARILYDLLLPWSDRFVHLDILCRPPVAYSLGLLATVLDRHDEADEHFRVASDIAVRVRSPMFLAMAEVEWAAMLSARGDEGRARDLLATSLEAATRFGWGAIEQRARDVLRSRA